MDLQLDRPLAFFDLETTGINLVNDRIVEISILKIMPDGNEHVQTHRVNPTIPIPPEVTKIHGINDEDVKDEPTFEQLAKKLYLFLDECDLAGYNSNRFDIPMLVEEFLRVGINFSIDNRKLIDVQRIFHMMEKRTLEAAYKFYCDKELIDAHSAEADTRATFEVLLGQLKKYDQVPKNVDALDKYLNADEEIVDLGRRIIKKNNVELFNFGKYKGQPVEDVLRKEPQYYDWIIRSDFLNHTKQKLTEIKERMSNKPS